MGGHCLEGGGDAFLSKVTDQRLKHRLVLWLKCFLPLHLTKFGSHALTLGVVRSDAQILLFAGINVLCYLYKMTKI